MSKCVLCGEKASVTDQEYASRTIYSCPTCGVFVLSDVVVDSAKEYSNYLAAFFASRKLADNNETVLVSYDKARRDRDYLQLTVDQIVAQFPVSFSEKSQLVLKNLEHLSSYEGEIIRVEGANMCPVFYTRKQSLDALSFVIQSMQKMELLDVTFYSNSFFPCGVTITGKGWDRISLMASEKNLTDRVMVHYYTENEQQQVMYRVAALKALKATGYKMNEGFCSGCRNKIGHELIAQVKNNRFIICDISSPNGAAFYMAGVAKALGRTCILTCHGSKMEDLEVAIDQISVLSWNNEKELELQLINAIHALVD